MSVKALIPHILAFTTTQTNKSNLVDVKAMRITRYQFGRNYMNEYHKHYPISAPEEDLDARLALYSLRRYA